MKSYKRLLTGFLLAFLIVAPTLVLADPGDGGHAGGNPPGISNPLKANSLADLLIKVAEEAGKIGFYVVVFFIIWSGFLFVSAAGNKTKLETAKKTFLYTVIGAAILLGAVVFANVIKGTVDQLQAATFKSERSIV